MLGKWIHTHRREKGMKQDELASKLSLTKQSISGWETGRTTPSPAQIKELEKIFETKYMGGSMIREDGVLIPIRGRVWASPFRLTSAAQSIKSVKALPGEADCFALEVEGDSMTPIYNHGDIVICRPRSEVLSPFVGDDEGSYVPKEKYMHLNNRDCIVTVNDETCLKRVEIRPRKGLEWEMRLVSFNDAYPPVTIKFGDEFRCEAIVVRNVLPELPE